MAIDDDDFQPEVRYMPADRGSSDIVSSDPVDSASDSVVENVESVEDAPLGCGHRQSKRSAMLNDFVTYGAPCKINPTHTTLASGLGLSCTVPYPLANYVMCANFSARQRALAKID